MKGKSMTYIEMVSELNELIPDMYESEYYFDYRTDGNCHVISFCDIEIYNSGIDYSIWYNMHFESERTDKEIMLFLLDKAKMIIREMDSCLNKIVIL